MRKKIGLALMLLVFRAGAALAQQDDPSVYSPPVTPDPVQNNGMYFAPQVATAGTADPGPKLNSVKPDADCKPLNPCALPTPALQALPPPRQAARVSHGAKSSASS